MRRIRYSAAASLDGFIAGPNGETDWIATDPEFDFKALFSQFDTILVGRRTFQTMEEAGRSVMPGMTTLVFSRTLRQAEHPQATVISSDPGEILRNLRTKPGKDIWLFGGGALFGSLAAAGLVASVEIAVMPLLLGGGIPVFSGAGKRVNLKLTSHAVHKTGVVSLAYAIEYPGRQ